MKQQVDEGRDWVSILMIAVLVLIVVGVVWSEGKRLTTQRPRDYDSVVTAANSIARARWNIETNELNGGQRWLQFIHAGDGHGWEINWPADHPDYQQLSKLPACSQVTFTALPESCRPCPVGMFQRLFGTSLPAAELIDYLRVKTVRPPETKEGAS